MPGEREHLFGCILPGAAAFQQKYWPGAATSVTLEDNYAAPQACYRE